MQHRDRFDMKSVLLALLLMCVEPWRHHGAQVDGEEANKPPDGGGGMAFFALRSCHQLLSGEEGEFFSPDYLCSNPPLWCNWTIQVDPGKRIHLRLEDLTPDDACHLKQDQIHVDDDAAVAAGHVGGHEILQGCWREAEYTSASNTLDVVLLIGGWPHPPYRGFYGHYRAFGPPVVYNPQEAFAVRDTGSGPPLGPMDIRAFGPAVDEEQGDSDSLERPSDDGVYDYYDQRSAGMAELPEEAVDPDSDPEGGENLSPASENYSNVYPFTVGPTEPASTLGTSRSGRGANSPPPSHSDSAIHVMSPQQQRPSHNRELGPAERPPGAVRRNVDEASTRTEEEEGGTQGRLEGEEPAAGPEPAGSEVTEATDRQPPTPEGPELQGGQQTHPRPNVVEPLLDHRWNLDVRNHSEIPHLPGDHLFEVAAEVNFSPDLEESWDNLARSLLLSVKALISEQLEALHTPLSISSKRIKRLNAGALYILWLQIGPGPMGRQVHGAVHGAMQGLIAAHVGLGGSNGKATAAIVSVSTADVNECGTQLVLCDVNADCVNQFGSYSCRCRTGFLDESRLGSGGTACVDVKAAGCGSGPSTETKGIYVLFFLLSALVLMLLAAACTLYHRHRRGTFLVRCHSSGSVSPPDPNNNGVHRRHDAYPADPDLPPPPLPPRGPRGGWPQAKEGCAAVDLPLLRFSPLLPPDSYLEPREGGKT